MSRKYLICRQNKKNCPFRTLDIQLDIFICNYLKEYWREFNSGNHFGAKILLNRACEWIQKEEKRLGFICEISRKKTLDFLEIVKIGDTVFCRIAPHHEVKLLEKPQDDSEFVSCEAPGGQIVRIQSCHLSRVSKGEYYGEYFIDGTGTETLTQELKYKANYNGFRAEIERKDNGFLLKIYGDSQQEVDDFISLFLEQDFDISPYI